MRPGGDIGDVALLTSEAKKTSLFMPKGQVGFSRLQITLRPFFGVGRLSFGMLNDLMIDHQFRIPLRLGFYLSPLGFATSGASTGFPSSLMGSAMYSSSYFETGLGIGGTFSLHGTKAGLTINEFIRLGSLEGYSTVRRIMDFCRSHLTSLPRARTRAFSIDGIPFPCYTPANANWRITHARKRIPFDVGPCAGAHAPAHVQRAAE
jgi:hypothetical protein